MAAAAGDDSKSSDSSSSSSADDNALQDISSVDMRAFRARLVAYGLNFGNSSTPGIAAPAASAVRSRSTVESKWAHEISNIELGCLVVAKETLFTEQQTYFHKAVIMIIEHGEQGTAGLILNLPTSHKMGEVLDANLMSLPGLEQNTLYLGGSVGRRRADGLDVINLLHGCETVPGETVVEGVKLGGLKEALLHVADGRAHPDQFKFFTRYTGWAPLQLAEEVKAGV
eukprot:1349-Heterococcus_DN1.PRE.1